MFHLTKEEKLVLLWIALIVFIGTGVSYAFKRFPELKDSVHLIDSDRLYYKRDVNQATKEELIAIPSIGEYTARKIIELRNTAPIKNLNQLKSISGIRDKNFQKFSKYLKVTSPK